MKRSILLFLFLSNFAFGLVSWETTQVTQKISPLAKSAEAVFRFENIGGEPVTITEIKSSCGCTTAALDKKTYEPGESGEIVASLNVGSRQGMQRKSIRVKTDDGETTTLMMRTLIPTVLDIKPGFVFWKQGEDPDMKSIDLKVGSGIDEAVKIVSVTPDNEAVQGQLEEIGQGHFRLNLFTTSTDRPIRTRFKVSTNYPKEKPRSFYVYGYVK